MKDSINDEELNRIKETIYTNRLLELDNTTSRCEDMARQYLVYGRVVPSCEMYIRLEDLKKEDVIKSMKKYFNIDKRLSIGAVGDISDLPSLKELESYRIEY